MPRFQTREALAARIVELHSLAAPFPTDAWELGQLQRLWLSEHGPDSPTRSPWKEQR